jgi:hypothetical protein
MNRHRHKSVQRKPAPNPGEAPKVPADFGVQARTARRRRRLARECIAIASKRVKRGLPLDVALNHLALGGTELGDLAAENTIRRDLRALFGDPAGHLDGWKEYRDNARHGDCEIQMLGAYCYALENLAHTLGAFGRLLLAKLKAAALELGKLASYRSRRTQQPHIDCTLTAICKRRAHGYLRWAIENAYPGVRNRYANLLACFCRSQKLDREFARQLLLKFRAEIHDLWGWRFPESELLSIVRSVYRNDPEHLRARIEAQRSFYRAVEAGAPAA